MMMVNVRNMAAVLLLGATAGTGVAQTAGGAGKVIAITGAEIFDATGRAPFRGTVVIRDGRIADIGRAIPIPAGAEVLDAEGEALLPGFFDVHTHWTDGGMPGSYPQIANAYLSSGVTTVNDFNEAPEAFMPLRSWLGELTAPHVNMVARMSTSNGHGADWADTATTKWVDTPQAARAEIRKLLPYRPDFIKAFADGWRYGQTPDNTSMNLATLSALVDEAHKAGLKVLTHTVTVERGKDAARVGVDVIAHSLQDRELDAEGVRLIKSAGTFYAPTLAIYEPVKPGEPAPADMNDPATRQRFRKFDFAKHSVKALHDAGVLIALGTDAGISGAPHGTSSLHEMELLVDAGLTPAEAMIAGTSNSARALGLEADRGTIEKGKRADLVLLRGRPWENIRDVRRTDRVFIDGAVAYAPGMRLPAANLRTALAPIPARALIDDFERPDGRSSLDTLRVSDMDNGTDRSVMLAMPVPRSGGGHALEVAARMGQKSEPRAGVVIPLSRGSIRPVDARRFKGVRFQARGDGIYTVTINTLAGPWQAQVEISSAWRKVSLPFTAFRNTVRPGIPAPPWRGDDLRQIGIGASRPAATGFWLELDDIGFY